MKHIQIYENFLNELANPSGHFTNRFDLRATSVEFESGVEGLSDEDIAFAKERIVEIFEKAKKDLIFYDMSWNKGNRDIGYIFNFGDIILRKGDQFYYPVLKVPKEMGRKDYYTGSVFCAICYSDSIITIMIFDRTCKYGSDPLKCKDPLDKEAAYAKFEKDKRHVLRKENRPLDPYKIFFANDKDFGDAAAWKQPKINLIDLPDKEAEEKKKFDARIRGTVTVKKLTKNKSIIYVKNNKEFAKRYIKEYKNIGLKKDFWIEMFLSQTSDGPISTKAYFKKEDRILIEISKTTRVEDDLLALSLGYTHYVAEIERYSENPQGDNFFSCRIVGAIQKDI
jgi:hypothetical protein